MLQLATRKEALAVYGLAAIALVTVVAALLQVARRRSMRVPLGTLVTIAFAYVVLLAVASIASSERHVPLGTTLCFDRWCPTLTAVERLPGPARGDALILARIHVASIARRPLGAYADASLAFVDDAGRSYPAVIHVAGVPDYGAPLAPGAAVDTAVAAIVPGDVAIVKAHLWEGAWVDRFAAFDEESPFHEKTYYTVALAAPPPARPAASAATDRMTVTAIPSASPRR